MQQSAVDVPTYIPSLIRDAHVYCHSVLVHSCSLPHPLEIVCLEKRAGAKREVKYRVSHHRREGRE